MSHFVSEEDIDYDEILRRGGANYGDEDFALFKCPYCQRIYLLEYEVDTVYLDPHDLSRRVVVNLGVSLFDCSTCSRRLPNETQLAGDYAPPEVRVTWEELDGSDWAWVVQRKPPEGS